MASRRPSALTRSIVSWWSAHAPSGSARTTAWMARTDAWRTLLANFVHSAAYLRGGSRGVGYPAARAGGRCAGVVSGAHVSSWRKRMWRMSVVFPEPGVPTTRKRRPGGAFSSASLPRSLATVVADDAAVDLEAAPLLASEEREVPRSSLGVFGDAAEASGWVVLELVQPMARVTARVAVIRRRRSRGQADPD